MKSMIVLAFDSQTGASEAKDDLYEMQKEELIKLEDAAVVVRREDGHVKVKHAHSLVGAGALGGAFWGMLIGLIFLAPWLGAAVGAVAGAIGGRYADVGIDDSFIKDVGETVEPGHSALFLLATDMESDRVEDELEHLNPTVLQTNLSVEAEEELREAFAAEDVAA